MEVAHQRIRAHGGLVRRPPLLPTRDAAAQLLEDERGAAAFDHDLPDVRELSRRPAAMLQVMQRFAGCLQCGGRLAQHVPNRHVLGTVTGKLRDVREVREAHDALPPRATATSTCSLIQGAATSTASGQPDHLTQKRAQQPARSALADIAEHLP